jgi:hypothetical protein
MSLLCRIGWHNWAMQVRGFIHEGLVQPLRVRTCQKCNRSEREIFDQETGSAQWVLESMRLPKTTTTSDQAMK